MKRETLIAIFGSDEPLPETRTLSAGPLEVEVSEGAVRAVRWHDVEVLRGIDYPVRDANWGTYRQKTLAETAESDAEGFRYRRAFATTENAVEGVFQLRGAAGRLTAEVELVATRPVDVNRAGFVVLHPIAGVAGSPLSIRHADGGWEETTFPERISPSQPVLNIAGMVQRANGVTTEMSFSGDVFEMEDQRNWSDASFKTYCRPLRLPFPYRINPGHPVRQTVTLDLSGDGGETGDPESAVFALGGASGHIPEVTLSLEAGWEAPGLGTLPVSATRLRLDTGEPQWPATLVGLLPHVRGALDLELVTPDQPEAMDASLAAVARTLASSGATPRMVIALPAAYLRSYQPDGPWPSGATPSEGVAAVRRHFVASTVMGGTLSNFTELNRHPGGTADADVVTYGTTAIVHAADDLSVMQTLEALPQIFASASALAPGKPCHLGLVAIGARSNPYGAALAANPTGTRRAMTDDDPRQRGLFAAAWMVGAMAATAGSAVAGLSLAAPGGPLGISGEHGLRLAYHVLKMLAGMAGRVRRIVGVPAGMAAVAAEYEGRIAVVVANLTENERKLELRAEALVLPLSPVADDWLETASRQQVEGLELGPYGVAFAWMDGAGQS